jgi:type IV pilus assembly protein PilN
MTRSLFIGLAVGLLLPGISGWAYGLSYNSKLLKLDARTNGIEREIAKEQISSKKLLDSRPNRLKVKGETVALATVFDQIKPWSAMLQDIRERIPPGVQIKTIEQTKK